MSRLDEVLSRLNPEQYQAATSTSDCILVLAGAGSGKTSVLSARIANLQLNERVGTSNMLALTFTRLAAGEMKSRVASLVGDDLARNLTVGTFHSFCVQVLRDHAEDIGRFKNFSVYDQDDQASLIEACISDLRYKSHVKASKVEPWAPLAVMDADYRAVVDEYHFRLRRNNSIDLEGLLRLTQRLLTDSTIAMQYRNRFSHVFLDEYQDTDPIQDSIVHLMSPENLFVVGDPAQAIYGWRGAQVKNILTFADRHTGCEVIRLERNYRSTDKVLTVANRTIAQATFKSPLQLWTDKDGGIPELHLDSTEEGEANWVAERVKAMDSPLQDIAVLCRTNRQVEVIDGMLRQNAIQTFVVSNKNDPLNGFDARRIVDYMSVMENERDERAVRRVINWPVQRVSELQLMRIDDDDFAELNHPHLEFLVSLRRSIPDDAWGSAATMFVYLVIALQIPEMYESQGLDNRNDALRQAHESISQWELNQQTQGEPYDPGAFLRWLRTRDIQARLEQEQSDGVRILTVHGAKGLEWDHVFVVGCNEDVFPSRRGDPEEERRLFYVAVTRARETLHLSHVLWRESWGGRQEIVKPSRFLEALEGGVSDVRTQAQA